MTRVRERRSRRSRRDRGRVGYARQLDARRSDSCDEVGAKLWCHGPFAGLVPRGCTQTGAVREVVTQTHTTLAGPRSGFILSKEEYRKKIDSAVFPGQQGGPLMHAIAGKAVAFKIAASEEFAERQRRTIEGAQVLAERLSGADVTEHGISVLTGGTDVHRSWLPASPELDAPAEDLLHESASPSPPLHPWDPRSAEAPPACASAPRPCPPFSASSSRKSRHIAQTSIPVRTWTPEGPLRNSPPSSRCTKPRGCYTTVTRVLS